MKGLPYFAFYVGLALVATVESKCPFADIGDDVEIDENESAEVHRRLGEPSSPLKGKRKSNKNKNNNNVVGLTQADFEEGTYRITEPGVYRLKEDIEFGPQAANDYWPPRNLWYKFPPSAYHLGFFAAITIETDDVTIDLNGHELKQSKEFYLLQRFYNNIELNNRIFVSNEGVSSLNYQKTDKPVPNEPPVGKFITPMNVVIKNGSLGRASHAGIHGNSVEGLTVMDVNVHDFEVAGIQCK